MDNLGKRTRTTNKGITNLIEEMEARISGMEDILEKINHLSKKMLKLKSFYHNTSRKFRTL
jgi:archaellum component FlaC